MRWERHVLKIVAIFALIVAMGVAGFMYIEGWQFLDSLYMTAITISTVGYSEVYPLSDKGRVFAIILIFVGVGFFIYIISSTAEYLLKGHLAGIIGRRKMKKRIEALKNHCIVCGFGRVGQEVALEFEKSGMDFVVIDKDPDAIKRCAAQGYPYIEGDASHDENLRAAGIDRARGLVSALDSDAANVYVILSAKSLKKNIFAVARSERSESERKLLAAGADRVISPAGIGGRRLASQLLRPAVIEFLDVVMHSADIEIFMEEMKVRKGSRMVGVTMADARRMCTSGANIVAVVKQDGDRLMVEPSVDTVIEEGDMLIVIGTRKQLGQIEEVA